MSQFIDEVQAEFRSGKGGDGAASFLRESHVPRGGPIGSDGGRGGDILLIADRGKRTLIDFRYKSKFEAEDGQPARTNKKGRDAANIELRVPVGTIVTDIDTGDILADLDHDGARLVVCKGGRGGHGNLHYTSSVRQAPTFAEKGEPGRSVRAKLELKLLADVGLIGLPNAGKSTLLAQISAAKPKIADYPFTTIEPNLGVVTVGDDSFVVADLPGLIEGASEGHGLGHQFLKHTQRTKVLVHIVDGFPIDGSLPIVNYLLIEKELAAYSKELAEKPRVIAPNKMDLFPQSEGSNVLEDFKKLEVSLFPISAATGHGVQELLYALLKAIREAELAEEPVVIRPAQKAEPDLDWSVMQNKEGYRVIGRRIERLVSMTDLGNQEALRFLHRKLERIGVISRLRELGAQEGDTVRVGDVELSFSDE